MQDFELRLIGHGSPDGQVIAQDAASLATAVQTLATRLAKVAADRTGPGRSEACLEALSRVRLSGLLAGSTRIAFSLGDANALPIDHPVSLAVETAFWEVITGMVEGHPPPNLPDTVTTATWDLIGALTHAAPVVEVIQAGRGPVRIRTAEVNRAAWEVVVTPGASHETYHGRLEMLDLSTSTFAIRDGAGTRIKLKDVVDAHRAARLVDLRVAVTGFPVRDHRGMLKHVRDVEIVHEELPCGSHEHPQTLAEILASAPGPSEGGGLDLTDAAFESFMTAVRE